MFVPVQTAEEMREAVLHHLGGASVVIKAAAVADFKPVSHADRKLKKAGLVYTRPVEQFYDPVKGEVWDYVHGLKDLKPSTRQRFVALEFTVPPPEREIAIVVHEGRVEYPQAAGLVALQRIGQVRLLHGDAPAPQEPPQIIEDIAVSGFFLEEMANAPPDDVLGCGKANLRTRLNHAIFGGIATYINGT